MCSSSPYPMKAGTVISTLYINDPGTTLDTIINALERDSALIRSDLKPLFNLDIKDNITKKMLGIFGKLYIASAALYRDNSDYYPRNCNMPVILSCIIEVIPGELEIGNAMLFLGNIYYIGRANITNIFIYKGILRQEEN
ncbi:hypothetical protein DER44DRAFT_816187 [Fusarium oxysporum]|nr:hypothetical protein DER44DRAFT_816187 [Fusarium oxysporum]